MSALALLAVLSLPAVAPADETGHDPDNPLVPFIQPTVKERAVRVALVDSGINYLLPEIQQGLALTPDGELIGFDYWDRDARPFDAHPNRHGQVQRHGTQTASLLIREAPFIELVAYRYPRPDMSRMADLLAHADAHDVRVIGLPLGSNTADQWRVFESAAEQYPHILFVASAGNNGRDIDSQPVYPASLALPNMLVVTSADDFVRPAQGVNWGRTSVDYLVPAEMQSVLRFDGSAGLVSGSSYAVPRMVGLAARLLRSEPALDAEGLLAEIRRRFATGTAPGQISQGYVHDPRQDDEDIIAISETSDWNPGAGSVSATAVSVPIDVLVLDDQWETQQVTQTLDAAHEILSQCNLTFTGVQIRSVQIPDYLKDLETGASKTLMDAIRYSGAQRRVTVVFARDTRMNQPFDAEAFGKGNTRSRPWLTDSVWLTLALRDRGIGLAHELFHVLANSGEHNEMPGNLMLRRTTGSNRTLTASQCEFMRLNALDAGLADAG